MPKTRSPCPEMFRHEAVGVLRSGRSVPGVAEVMGVGRRTLRSWNKRELADRGERDGTLTGAEREALRELRGRVRRLEQERDILKRAPAVFAR